MTFNDIFKSSFLETMVNICCQHKVILVFD